MSELLREFIRSQLIEAKVDLIKQRFPLFATTLDKVNRIHPKYLEWSAKQLAAGVKEQDLLPTLRVFDKRGSSFEKRDVNAYKTLGELEDAVKALKPSRRAEKATAKADGAEKIFENEEYVILHIKTKDASVCYGTGTRWCITMTDARYFEQYTGAGVIFYFVINKTLPPDDPMSKVAFAIYRKPNGDRFDITQYEIFDALDNPIRSIERPYTKFLEIVRDDAATRPEPPQMALARAAKEKVHNKTATDEEALAYIESLDDDAMSDFVETFDTSFLKSWPVSVYRALVTSDKLDAIKLGFEGLRDYRDYETMRKAFVKNRWSSNKREYIYLFPKSMLIDLMKDEMAVDAPSTSVIQGIVKQMDDKDLMYVFNNYSRTPAGNAAEDEINRRYDWEQQKKNKKPYSPWGI